MTGRRGLALLKAGLPAVLLIAAAAALLVAGPGPGDLTQVAADPAGWARRRGVDGAVVDALALLSWAGLLWLLLGAAVAVLAHLPGVLGRAAGRIADTLTPVLVRRLVEALLGVTALTGVVTTGTASATPLQTAASVSSAGDPAVAGLPVVVGVGAVAATAAPPDLDWPVAAAVVESQVDADWPVPGGHGTPAPTPATAGGAARPAGPPPAGHVEVVVVRGDTLWSIAARHLGPGAGDEEINRSWPAWHDANRDVIGPDPDRLLPGQRLAPPA